MAISREARAPLGTLYLVNGLTAAGSGLGMPYIVAYLHLARAVPLVEVGALLAIGSMSGLAVSMVFGLLGHRLRLGSALAIAIGAGALGYGAMAIADHAWIAIVAVLASYLAQAVFWVAGQTIVGSIVTGRVLDHVFARLFLATNAGIGLASALGGLYLGRGSLAHYEVLWLVAAGIEAMAAVLVAVRIAPRVPRSLPVPSRQRGGYRALLRSNVALRWYLLIEIGLLLAGYAQLDGGWGAFVVVEVGARPAILGFALTVNTIVIVVLQVPISRATKRWRRSRQLLAATIAWAGSWAIAAVALLRRDDHGFAAIALIVAMGVFAVGETLYSPVAPALVNALASEEERARANALSGSLWSTTSVLASPLAATVIALAPRFAWILCVLGLAIGLAIVQVPLLARILPRELDAPTPDGVDD